MMLDVRQVADQQPVLRITLDTGESFRVGPEQVLFKRGMIECRADFQLGAQRCDGTAASMEDAGPSR